MKRILLFVIIGWGLFACSEQEGNVEISGEIRGLSQGKLYIQRLQDTVLKPIKVIKFDGESKFKTFLNIEEPEVLYLYLDRGTTNSLDNNFAFFVEKGKMTIHSDINGFISKTQIKGSHNQELWDEYKKIIANYNEKSLEYLEQRLLIKEGKEHERDSLERLEEGILKRKYLYTVNFCINNKEKEIAPYLALTEIYDANKKYLDTIHNSLSEPILQSKYGKMFTAYLKDN